MRFLFRLLALFALAVAVIMAVVDATRSIAANAWTVTPLIESWRAASPDTLAAVRQAVETHTVEALWNPVLTSVLSLPGWLIFAALALCFHASGRRRRPDEPFVATM